MTAKLQPADGHETSQIRATPATMRSLDRLKYSAAAVPPIRVLSPSTANARHDFDLSGRERRAAGRRAISCTSAGGVFCPAGGATVLRFFRQRAARADLGAVFL